MRNGNELTTEGVSNVIKGNLTVRMSQEGRVPIHHLLADGYNNR